MTATPTPGDLSARLPSIESLMTKLGTDDPVFDQWRNTVPDKHWVTKDLSALYIGYELGKSVAALSALPAAGGLEERHYLAAWEAARSLTHIAGMAHVGKAWKDMADAASKGVYAVFGEAVDADWHGRTPWLTTPQPSAAEDADTACYCMGPDVACPNCEQSDAAVGAQGEVEWLAYVCRCAADMIERRESPCYVNDLRRASDLIRRLATTPQPSAAEDDEACRCVCHTLLGGMVHSHECCASPNELDAAAGAQGDGFRAALEQIAAETSASNATEAADRFQRIARDALAAPAAGKGVDDLLREALPYLQDHTDDGPEHAPWKSPELSALIGRIAALLPLGKESLADTQRAIIEAAERRGYELAQAEAAAPAAGKGVDDAMVERALSAPYGNYSVSSFIPLKSPTNVRNLMRAALEAALTRQPVAGDGMVLVPREPTFAMRGAAQQAFVRGGDSVGGIWAAMIAAAPAATPTDGGEG